MEVMVGVALKSADRCSSTETHEVKAPLVRQAGIYELGKRAKDLYRDYSNERKFSLTKMPEAGITNKAYETSYGVFKHGHYSEIGLLTRELLYKGYLKQKMISLMIHVPPYGLTTTADGTLYPDLFHGAVTSQIQSGAHAGVIKMDTYSNLATFTLIDVIAPTIKASTSIKYPDASMKFELHWLNDFAGFTTRIVSTRKPMANFSGFIGNDRAAIGADVALDLRTGKFVKYAAGISYANAGLIASLKLADEGDTLIAKYYQSVHPFTKTAVGAEFTHAISINENILAFGAQHALDPLTMVKARMDSLGIASALIQHQWRDNVQITLSGQADVNAFESSGKFGLIVALKAV